MEFTIGFLMLFAFVVLPGLIFQRLYYQGEFSKQFSSKENIYKSILYSIFPGIVIQLLVYLLYKFFNDKHVNFSKIISVYKELIADNSIDEKLSNTIDSNLNHILLYILIVYLFSFCSGAISFQFIRFFKIDRKFKILRFKNQWWYIFSGELLTLSKFVKTTNYIDKSSIPDKDYRTLLTYADILVKTDDSTKLYSGYIVDYDLKSEDISKLDKVYISLARRYKKETKLNGNIKVVKKNIPGHVFVLSMENVVNINLTYVPSPKKRKVYDDKQRQLQKIYRGVWLAGTLTQLSVVIFLLFKDFDSLARFFNFLGDFNIFKEKENSSLIRLWLFMFSTQIIYIFIPKINDSKYYYSKRTIGINIIIAFLMLALLYFLKHHVVMTT